MATVNINWRPVSSPPASQNKRVLLVGGRYPVGCDRFKDRHEDRTHWAARDDVPAPALTQAEKDEQAWHAHVVEYGSSANRSSFFKGLAAARQS